MPRNRDPNELHGADLRDRRESVLRGHDIDKNGVIRRVRAKNTELDLL